MGLIREGTKLDAELTTKPIAGVDWTVDTAFIYHQRNHPKTIPVLVRHLKQKLNQSATGSRSNAVRLKRPVQSVKSEHEQLSLLA